MKKIFGFTLLIFLLVSTNYAYSLKINSNNIELNSLEGNESQWTIMVYLDGDNNLQNDMEKSIGWLAFNGYNNDVKIVAQFDSFGLFDGIRRYEITENGAEIVETLDEKSMGDEETLVDFVSWAKNKYPANRYCLFLSDHGVGWRNGFLQDDTDQVNGVPDYLSMAEFKSCMNTIKNDILGNNELDLLMLDACQMNMVEVIYQIRGTTKVCVASPGMIRQAGRGAPFHKVFDDLYNNVDCDERVLAEYFYDAYDSFFSYSSVVVYDVEIINSDLIPCLDAFSIELIDNYQKCKNEIKEAISNTKTYNGEGGYVLHYRDLYDFADELSDITTCESVKIKANELKNVLLNCKICPSGTFGLSIYLPVHNLKYKYDPSYSDMDMSKDINWYEFILKTKNIKNKSAFNIFESNVKLLRFLELIYPSFFK